MCEILLCLRILLLNLLTDYIAAVALIGVDASAASQGERGPAGPAAVGPRGIAGIPGERGEPVSDMLLCETNILFHETMALQCDSKP